MSNPQQDALDAKVKDQVIAKAGAAGLKPLGPSLSDPAASNPATPAAASTDTPRQVADAIDAGGIDILNQLDEHKLSLLASMVQDRLRAKTVSKNVNRHITDFSAVQEKDIFNLDIPIEALSHEAPDFMIVTLADPEYIARWIFKHPQRIGVMKAYGFSYVTADDLAEDLKLEIQADESDHFYYMDTVLMKIPKAKYFGRLRKQFLRSKDSINPRAVHERMKATTNNEMANMPDEKGNTYSQDFAKYNSAGQIKAYRPGVDL